MAKKTVQKAASRKTAVAGSRSRSRSAPDHSGAAGKAASRKVAVAARPAPSTRSATSKATSKRASRPESTPKRAVKTPPAQPSTIRLKKTRTVASAQAAAAQQAALDSQIAVGRVAKPLAPAEIEEFRQMLLHKRAEILGDVNTLQGETLHVNRQDAAGDLSTMPIHMADLGSDNYELEFTLGLIEGERAILKEIDEALDRVREGSYGLCLATGNPIGKARLRAKPWAKYCYEYTLAQEKGRVRGL